ncbi:hypothetical protein HanRHA438_Chr14g0630081 [Helianthus annuus]|nr:hypothetical protein HanRHA438_Chr14g0630081 [Helianthus annuus]
MHLYPVECLLVIEIRLMIIHCWSLEHEQGPTSSCTCITLVIYKITKYEI